MKGAAGWGLLDRKRLHRIEGTGVLLGACFLLFFVSSRCSGIAHHNGDIGIASLREYYIGVAQGMTK